MRHIKLTTTTDKSYKVAILIKNNGFREHELRNHYLSTLDTQKGVIAFNLLYKKDKALAKDSRQYLNDELLPALISVKADTIICCDTPYFKYLTGAKKVKGMVGSNLPCKIEGYEHMEVFLAPNYNASFYNPAIKDDISFTINQVNKYLNHGYNALIPNRLKNLYTYVDTAHDINNLFQSLINFDLLSCDIEGTSLKHIENNIISISFSPDENTSYVIYFGIEGNYIGYFFRLFYRFINQYRGKLIFHNANYDLKNIIYHISRYAIYDRDHSLSFYENEQKHLIKIIEAFKGKVHDTKLISYLSLNRTTQLSLSLKDLVKEYLGNYAEDVTDVANIDPVKLIQYNAKDTIGTFYLFNKYYPQLVKDNQLDVYNKMFIPSIFTLLHMELTGVFINTIRVNKADEALETKRNNYLDKLLKNKYVKETIQKIRLEAFLTQGEKWKVKRESQNYFDNIDFNYASINHVTKLIYEIMQCPVIARTDKGKPSLQNKTLIELKNIIDDPVKKEVLELLIEIGDINKIKNTFLKAFRENSYFNNNAQHYFLHGNYNLGGTVSGRLSSSQPNLQNLPSGSKYGKLIKECFVPPSSYVMMGADFDSLEDKVSALITRDTNKLKVYTDQYDGHCLRAYSYFGHLMPDIENTVESINSIKQKYPELRNRSKGPTFLLTYGGTNYGLQKQLGIPKEDAIKIEDNYHELYKESDQWVADKIELASQKGYVDVAFGLRVRAPILHRTYLGKESTPREAEEESRTIGNALGQSYGMLNNRAANEFQERVYNSPYRLNIFPVMQIHDSMYFMVKRDLDTIKWFNDNLIECMEWNELSELQHPQVKLSAEVGIFYPDWSNEITLPNRISKKEIKEIIKQGKADYLNNHSD